MWALESSQYVERYVEFIGDLGQFDVDVELQVRQLNGFRGARDLGVLVGVNLKFGRVNELES